MKKPTTSPFSTEPAVQVESNIWIDVARLMDTIPGPDGALHIRSGFVSGWAVGPEPFVRIDIVIGEKLVATAAIGRYRPDVALLYPDYPHAEYTGFEAKLTAGVLPATSAQFIILASTQSGTIFVKRQPFLVTDLRQDPDATNMRTHIEKCELDASGMVCVSGWALSKTPIVSIQVMSDGQKIAGTLPNLSRPDIVERFANFPNADRSGFYVTGLLDKKQITKNPVVTIEIIARDGTLRRIVTSPQFVTNVSAAPTQPHVISFAAPVASPPAMRAKAAVPDMPFHFDFAVLDTNGRFHASGWVLPAIAIKRISILFAGNQYGVAATGKFRADVAQAYDNAQGALNSGFELETLLPGPINGSQKIALLIELSDDTKQSVEFDVTPIEAGAHTPGDQESEQSIRLAVDDMQISNGHARRVITQSFSLVGWAVALVGIAKVDIYVDDRFLGQAYHGVRREDISAAFPQYHNALLCGFAFSVSLRQLTTGQSRFRLVATDLDQITHEESFTIDIDIDGVNRPHNSLRHKMSWAEAQTGLDIMAARGLMPTCDILLRLDAKRGVAQRVLATAKSIAEQAWPEWRIWFAQSAKADTTDLLARMSAAFPDHAARFGLMSDLPQLLGPGYIFSLAAGDTIAVDGMLSALLAADPQDDLIFADDRRPDPLSQNTVAAFMKPGWSPDLLMSQNYIGRAWLASRRLLAKADLTPADLIAAGDYGTVLALTHAAGAGAIRHVPGLMLETAGSHETPAAERRALAGHLRAIGVAAQVQYGAANFLHRVVRKPVIPATVSIIIPSIGAKDHIKVCIDSIRRHSGNIPVEIIVVDNLRRKGLTKEGKTIKAWFRQHADTVVEVDEPFNWSRLNNKGAAAARGDYLLFLNDDMEVITPDWLQVLVSEAARPDVGVVGAHLIYPDGKVQHAGLFMSRSDPGTARHAFRFAAIDDPCYFGLALSQRNVTCVTGACMMVRRDVFDDIQGFDEAHSVVNNDIDFCLRLYRSGRHIIFTPYAKLTHFELASRAEMKDDFDRTAFLETWGDLCITGDPFLNPAISADADDYPFEEEPLREVYAGYPLGARDQIKRILAIKLDHIGDLVTSLPAMRRLKALFPKAHLTALVAKSSTSIAMLEPSIDALLPFEFFDARSGAGRKKLTKSDYAALDAQLSALNFDLAVDLRKHADTRHILQHSGAALLAGFDYAQEFSWLDISLEGERDTLQRDKRSHVAADMLNLVEAIGTAFTVDRYTVTAQTDRLPPISTALRQEFAALFDHDYVTIHAAAGTPARQWSPVSFGSLIDRLIEENGMRVALIGGPDELEIANLVLASTRRKDLVFNLVGRSKLAELPRIISDSVLFVGNNSGPSHIASGLGVPTVSVHSAIVSSEEWGPLGASAVALRRDMSCAPCYVASVDQCHRNMACLRSISPHAVHQICHRFLSLRSGHKVP